MTITAAMVHEVGAVEQTGRIYAGLGSAEITPTQDMIESYGWGKVIARLYVKVMILRVGELSVAWVTYDALAVSSPERLREAVVETTGIPAARVLIAATHTHGDAPQYVPEVITLMVDRTREAAQQAAQGMFPARVGVSHRELPAEMNENRNVDVSPPNTDLFVMRIDDREGNLQGIVFNYPSHPTPFSFTDIKGSKFDADYPERVRQRLVEWYAAAGHGKDREKLWSMFSLGPAAHYQPWDNRFSDPLHTPEWFVESLAYHVLDLSRRTLTRAQVRLGIRSRLNYLYAITLDDAVIFTVPGELSEELAERARSELRSVAPTVIFSTMTNGYEGYLVSGSEELEQVTYEAKMDPPRPGEEVIDDLVRLMKPGYSGREKAEWVSEMGRITGRVLYDAGDSSLLVGMMDHAERPIDDWRFNGRSVPVIAGAYEIVNVAPGVKFLHVLAITSEDNGTERRVLTYGLPVFMKPGERRTVDFDFSRAKWKTAVQEIILEEDSIRAEAGAISGRVSINGGASDGEIEGIVYPWIGTMILDSGRSSVPEPLRRFPVAPGGIFKVDSLPAGTYGLVFMVDANGNERPEPAVDVVSTVSKPVVVQAPSEAGAR